MAQSVLGTRANTILFVNMDTLASTAVINMCTYLGQHINGYTMINEHDS